MSKFYKPKPTGNIADKTGATSRASAAMIVDDVEKGVSFSECFAEHTKDLDPRDRALVSEIVYGTLRHRRLLNSTLEPLLEHKISSRFNCAKTLILCAFYQLVFMRTPPHAVVSSTVSACGLCRCKGFAPLVNAILRRFLREGAHLIHSSNETVEYSFPNWLYDKIKQTYKDKTKEILIGSNDHAPLFIRVLTDKISLEEYEKVLDKNAIAYSRVDTPFTLHIQNAMSASSIPLFDDGLVTIQDLSAQRAAPLLDLEDNMTVLDACAAPGGKTAHILSLAKNLKVTAIDVDAKRLEVTQKTLERLNLKATLKTVDAQNLDAFADESFDRILVDAPCSGTGVIRRHPDIKWLRRHKDIDALCQIQKNILDSALKKLKVGGILVYTTCSILKEENEDQVLSFLDRHDNVKSVHIPFSQDDKDYVQVLPKKDLGDGFFYAKFIKHSK